MDKEALLANVKDWIILDDEIKTANRELKEKRKRKKELTETLVNTMKNNEIDCFDLSGGSKLIYLSQLHFEIECIELLRLLMKTLIVRHQII